MNEFGEINDDLEKSRQLELRQPLPYKQVILLVDASFQAAGSTVMTPSNPNQELISAGKTYAPVAYGSKTFTPAQIKMSIYAKEFSAK